MRKILVRVAWAGCAVAGALVFLILAILVLANTSPGRNAITALLNPLLGGKVAVAGLSGRFPDAPTAAHIEISDERGVWLKLDHVSVKWSPLQLLRNRIVAHSATAERAIILREPIPSKSEGTNPPVDIKHLEVGRLTIDRSIAPRPAVISIAGSLHYVNSHEFSGVLHASRLNGIGQYDVRIGLLDSDLKGSADIREPADGLIQDVLRLPALGPVRLMATAAGPTANDQVRVSLAAGPLRAGAQGSIDLAHRTANISFSASSPAMKPNSGLSWQSVSLAGQFGGSFAEPNVTGHLGLQGFKASGASASNVAGDLQGNRGEIRFKGAVTALRIPGAHPDLLASSPVVIDAVGDVAARTLDATLSHPLLSASAHMVAGAQATQGVFALRLPSIAPLAEAAGADAQGNADLNAIVTMRSDLTTIAFNGAARLDDGTSPIARAIGRDTRVAGIVSIKNGTVVIDSAKLDSNGMSGSAYGSWQGNNLNVTWALSMKDLSRLATTLAGHLALQGTLSGRVGNLAASARGEGAIATKGYASGPLHIVARVQSLPQAPAGNIDVAGVLDKAPLALAAKISRNPKGAWHFVLDKGDWRSLRTRGDIVAAGSLKAPAGKVELHAGSLADVEPLIGQPVKGRLEGVVTFAASGGHARAQLDLAARGLTYNGIDIATLKFAGGVADPMTTPVAAVTYVANGLSGKGVTGNLSGSVKGPQSALALSLSSNLRAVNGQAVQIASTATVNVPKLQLTLSKYDVRAGGTIVHLLAPARFDFAKGIGVDSFRIASGKSEFDAAGRFSPRLDATLNLRHATGDLLKPFFPSMATQGTLSATAKLSGTLAAPQGSVVLNGKGLRIGVDGGGAMPPADLVANATLHGRSMTLNANVRSGTQIQFSVAGEAPLKPAGPFNLHASGTENLAMLDPILNAVGRSMHGNLTVNTQVTGTLAQPRVSGSGHLAKGEFQDFVRGVRVFDIATDFDAHGEAIAINRFSARAGDGTIAGAGNIDLTAPGEPVSLSLTARNARPVSNDVVNATLDANIKLEGKLAQAFTLSGNVSIDRGEIDIPDNLPPQVAVLDIHGKGKAPPPKPIAMALDLTLASPGQLFVRGHGLDAEMSGRVHIGGTTLAPDVSGSFELRRGNLSIAGQTLDFSSGRVSFDGTSLSERIDPALDFTAQTTAGGVTATLNVGGHASLPKITLTSVPPLPQDEILSRLLFQQNMTQLNPWQMAQLGQALASLGGGSGMDPLTRVRKSLGLDRLAVTTAGATGTETAVEAGRYVARNIYVGAKQGVSGSGTQAVVQVDLTKHLKLQTQISSNNTPTPVTPGTVPVDTGSNLGLSYQFEY